MRKFTRNPFLTLLASIVLLFGAAGAVAQGQTMPGTQAETVEVNDQDVDNFVSAYLSVQEINQEYTEKLQAVDAPEEATELQQEAQTKMQEAISDSGLSLSEYQQIANQASQDEDLRGQIEQALASAIE